MSRETDVNPRVALFFTAKGYMYMYCGHPGHRPAWKKFALSQICSVFGSKLGRHSSLFRGACGEAKLAAFAASRAPLPKHATESSGPRRGGAWGESRGEPLGRRLFRLRRRHGFAQPPRKLADGQSARHGLRSKERELRIDDAAVCRPAGAPRRHRLTLARAVRCPPAVAVAQVTL